MDVLLIARLLRGVGRWARIWVNLTSCVGVVTQTDRPKSVRNRCIIEFFVALFVLSLYTFDNSIGIGVFVIEMSQISSFFLFTKNTYSACVSFESCMIIDDFRFEDVIM